jgi:hypothetical protein
LLNKCTSRGGPGEGPFCGGLGQIMDKIEHIILGVW